MINGVITKGIGGFYYVATDTGLVECSARGRFRKQKIKPYVGDYVNIIVDGAQGVIEEILPRKNNLIRPPVSNIDQIVVVIAATMPQPDLFVVDKLILQAEKNGIDAIVCVNKTDLANPEEILKTYQSAGYEAIAVCALDNHGMEPLKKRLQGKITAFAGNSGVGKSSILNALGFSLETGEISRIEHGKHTTRHVELMPFGVGGFVIDTPGFSLLDISDIRAEELAHFYPEFRDLAPCGFLDCAHIGGKGCSVIQAVENGSIASTRYESYVTLYNELKKIKEWER